MHDTPRLVHPSLYFEWGLSDLFWIICGLTLSSVPVCHPLLQESPVALVHGAVVGNIFPFRTLSSLCFLYNQLYVLVAQLHPQGVWVPSLCGYSRDSLHLFDICLRLNFLAEYTLLSMVFGKAAQTSLEHCRGQRAWPWIATTLDPFRIPSFSCCLCVVPPVSNLFWSRVDLKCVVNPRWWESLSL
jgi:hypothetical protein